MPDMQNQSSPYRGNILISGASTGIGLCCAQRLAELGFRVFAGYRSDADAERLSMHHPNISPIRLDVTSAESIEEARRAVETALNGEGLAGLVNNAGIVVGGPLECLPLEAFRQQLEVNVTGVVALTQAFTPLLRQAKGRIVNMGSVAGISSLPFVGPYAASKHALEALTDALRVELRPWGIKVAIIQPGVIATPIWEKSLKAADDLEPHFPPQVNVLYGRVMEILRKETRKADQRGIAPDYVANAVVHALTANRPRTRYLIGWDARLRVLFKLLPDRWQDWLIIKKVGFPS
jgi:NAD(P)-dependent dehydrogenase (short-subunit alcohol dehydrogenase family)